MKVKEVMERAGTNETGKAVAYIKDALEEINILTEVHMNEDSFDIIENQRYYSIPNDAIKVIEITVKNHLNSKDEYRSIPRTIYIPPVKDGNNS